MCDHLQYGKIFEKQTIKFDGSKILKKIIVTRNLYVKNYFDKFLSQKLTPKKFFLENVVVNFLVQHFNQKNCFSDNLLHWKYLIFLEPCRGTTLIRPVFLKKSNKIWRYTFLLKILVDNFLGEIFFGRKILGQKMTTYPKEFFLENVLANFLVQHFTQKNFFGDNLLH